MDAPTGAGTKDTEIPQKIEACTQRLVHRQKTIEWMRLDDVAALESLVADMALLLRRLHNHLIPMHQLPPEIMCDIFRMACDSDRDYVIDTLGLTHVCERWRDVAVSYAPLWSNMRISDGHPEVYLLFLERSKSAALDVTIRLPFNYDTVTLSVPKYRLDVLASLAPEHRRIRTLDVILPVSAVSLLTSLNCPLPNLQSLSFTNLVTDYDDVEDYDMPSNWFAEAMPQLKAIILGNVHTLSLQPFTNLSSVRLFANGTSRRLLASAFFSFLRRSPLLERLSLESYGLSSTQDTEPPISLLSLTHLTLESTQSRLIMAHLTTPALKHLEVVYPSLFYDEVNDTYIHPALPDDTSTFCISEQLYSLSISQDHESYTFEGRNASGRLIFLLHDEYNRNYFVNTLEYLSRTKFSALKHLSVHANYAIYTGVAEKFLSQTPLLSVLQLTEDNYQSALWPLFEDSALCTRLTRLEVVITRDSYVDVFETVRAVIVARAMCGQDISVRHMIMEELDDGEDVILSGLWNDLCDRYQVKMV